MVEDRQILVFGNTIANVCERKSLHLGQSTEISDITSKK